jgi:Mitochondrial carrier protein
LFNAGFLASVIASTTGIFHGRLIQIMQDRAAISMANSGKIDPSKVIPRPPLPTYLVRSAAPAVMGGLTGSMRFLSFELVKQRLMSTTSHEYQRQNVLPLPQTLLAGAIAGFGETFIMFPKELAERTLSAIPTGADAKTANRAFKGRLHVIQSLLSEGGVFALWRGYTPQLLIASTFAMAKFGIYEQLKAQHMIKYAEKAAVGTDDAPFSLYHAAKYGAITGAIVPIIATPVSSLVTVSHGVITAANNTPFAHLTSSYGRVMWRTMAANIKYGGTAFLKSAGVIRPIILNAMRLIPSTALLFTGYEYFKQQQDLI